MSKRNLEVTVSALEESLARFKNAWQTAQDDETISPSFEIVSFENASSLMKTLSPKRLELLQMLHSLGASSIRMLAKALGRDYSNVYQDTLALYQNGLILKDETDKYYMPWEKISAEIPMSVLKNKPAKPSRKMSAKSPVARKRVA